MSVVPEAPAPAPVREGLPYHLVLRGGWPGKWRPLVGLLALAAGMLLLLPLLVIVPFAGYYLATGQEVGSSVGRLVDLTDPTPAGLAYLNLALAGLIPLVWLLVRFIHGLRPRWVSSVFPRLRWGYLFICMGLAFIALIATVAVSALLPQDAATAVGGGLNDFTPTLRNFLLVVLFLTPLQAAAEEYAFRGYLLQAFGGLVPQPVARRRGVVPAVRARPWRPGRADLLRPVRVRRGGRHPRHPHRRPRSRHRDARAEQLAGVQRRARVR